MCVSHSTTPRLLTILLLANDSLSSRFEQGLAEGCFYSVVFIPDHAAGRERVCNTPLTARDCRFPSQLASHPWDIQLLQIQFAVYIFPAFAQVRYIPSTSFQPWIDLLFK
ncbi:hypothetical protein EDB19DRAFT_1739621 [Suillus lakei]|nr:hypothetical protein EDB19DRAFT_1739621 [Suillus lakei]